MISLVGLACIFFVLISATSKPTTDHNQGCGIENSAFKSGEKLTYKLYYHLGLIWIPAGEAHFFVHEEADFFELKVRGKTYSSYENLFKVDDYFYSKVDKRTLMPQNAVRIIHEGNYRLYDSLVLDKKQQVALSFYGNTKSTAKQQILPIHHCMHDVVSNIYYLRNTQLTEMQKGQSKQINMVLDKKIYPINIKFGGTEVKKIKDLGEFKTIKISPDLVEGNVFKKNDRMNIWVSNDQNKIPLLIESPISVGSIKAVLKSHEGLKYALTSKIIE